MDSSQKSKHAMGALGLQLKLDRLSHTLVHFQNDSSIKQIECNDLSNHRKPNDQSLSDRQVKPALRSPHLQHLCCHRVLNTGFGDRLSVYLSVAAAADTVLAEVYAFWDESSIDA
jgi:hypothetical protein